MSLAERYSAVRERIRTAAREAGRDAEEITLVAVSKRQPDALIAELVNLGHRDFGENLIQAWQARTQRAFATDMRWHVMGPVQTNKAKFVARTPPALLHTIDRASLVEALERRWSATEPLDVLAQVNIDREVQKAGCAPEELDALVDRITASSALRLRGLMVLPRATPATPPRAAFSATRALLDGIADRIERPPVLSMGMSSDFEAAVAEGSTLVRVGTALFGHRS